MAEKAEPKKKQERLVVIAAFGIVAVSIITTLYITGVSSSLGGRESSGYNNVTFTDAVITCEEQTRQAYKGELQSLVLDDHSSRFEQRSNTYKIFFNASMGGKSSRNRGEAGPSVFFINCYVNGSQGRISSYEAYEDKEMTTKAIRKDDGGLFGWPLKK